MQVVTAICEVCSRSFSREKRKAGKMRVCSVACRNVLGGKTISQSQSGARNPNWRGGVSKERMRYKRRFREKYPEKVRAHDAVKRAVKSGRLVRKPCEVCGGTHDVEAHHDDYSRPLDVRWMCAQCHASHHSNARNLAK